MNNQTPDRTRLDFVPQNCVAFNIGKAYRSVLKIYEDAYKEGPLTTMQYGLLVHISMFEPASSSDISLATGHDLSTLTRTIAPLLKSGFIQNLGTDTLDKRVKRYGLTREGKNALEETLKRWDKAQRSIMGQLSSGEWDLILPILKKLQGL